MAKYTTKQRKYLLGFLSEHIDEKFSAKQIAKELEKDGISVSAVYRNISELENEGLVKRSAITGSREVYYQYTADKKCSASLHLSCKSCGKMFHMNNDSLLSVISTIKNNDGFLIDKSETVLYGICSKCNSKELA